MCCDTGGEVEFIQDGVQCQDLLLLNLSYSYRFSIDCLFWIEIVIHVRGIND
jgi:hypothetical protein